MDPIDKNILTDLMINCRTTYQEMALKYNLSANAIKKRINNMISKGVIEQFTISLSLEMIDAEIMMSIVHTDGTEDEEKFIIEIGTDPRFSAVGKTSVIFTYVLLNTSRGYKDLMKSGLFLINFNIRRNPADEQDTYAADVILEQVALHIKVDTLGSRQIYIK